MASESVVGVSGGGGAPAKLLGELERSPLRQEGQRQAAVDGVKAQHAAIAANLVRPDENVANSDSNSGQRAGTLYSESELAEAVATVADFLQNRSRNLSFAIDEQSGKTVVKVVDGSTSEVIRQIPSEEVLAISRTIKELQQEIGQKTGILLDGKSGILFEKNA